MPSASFTRNLRYELAGEEGRAMLGSYAISFALGLAFLLLVYLYPPIEERIDEPPQVVVVEVPEERPPPPQPEPTAEEPAPQQREQPRPAPQRQPQRTTQTAGGDVSDAFRGQAGTGGLAGNVAGVLSGVDIASGTGGSPGSAGTGTRAVISGGTGTGTAPTPGRGGVTGDPGAGGQIGRVGGTGGVGRARVGVSAPRAVDVPDIGRSRNMGDLGTYVRSRQAELRFCYEEHGLKVNPGLAGTITVSIGIAESGRVTSASISNRTWSGAGVSAVESCVLSRIRGWRFPAASGVGTGTYAFPFNFTR
jgi:TonB family protein